MSIKKYNKIVPIKKYNKTVSVKKYNKIVPIKKYNKTVSIKKYNKTVSIKENISLDSCKPFFASSVLFSLVGVIITDALFIFMFDIHSKRRELNHQICEALI